MPLSQSAKTRFLSALLFSAALFPVSVPAAKTQAPAQAPETYFYPATPWSVAPAPAQTGQGKSCTMATAFNNGFIMQLSATPGDVQTMQLNLRQSVLQPGASLNVGVAVPGVMTGSLPARVISAEALNINLEGQADLYRHLKQAGVVDMNILGNMFRFYLTGFAGASVKFESCISGAASLAAKNPDSPHQIPLAWSNPAVTGAKKISEDMARQQEEEGRAPPPPMQSLQTPTELEIKAAKAQQQQQERDESYARELMQIMPEEEGYKVPIQEVIPVDGTLNTVDVSRPRAISPRPVQRQRLTEMLEEEMIRQHEEMEAQNPDYINTYRETEIVTPEPMIAPLVQEGSAAEKALMEILTGKAPAPPPPAPAAEPPPALEVTPEESPAPQAEQQKPSPPAAAPIKQPDVMIQPNPVPPAAVAAPKPPTAPAPAVTTKKTPDPVISREVTKIEADFTDLGVPQEVPAARRKSDKNWLEMIDDAAAPSPARRRAATDPALTPEPQSVMSVRAVPPGGGDMEDRIRVLETQLSAIAQENAALQNELDFALEQGKEETVAIASDNWNLEQSTKRYNEAKRQIDRLGQELRKERAQCAAEKKELETMLFDPKLTSDSQLAKLGEMEDKLADAERQLIEQRQTYEARIKLLQEQAGR